MVNWGGKITGNGTNAGGDSSSGMFQFAVSNLRLNFGNIFRNGMAAS
jgi:hypothetical protein